MIGIYCEKEIIKEKQKRTKRDEGVGINRQVGGGGSTKVL